MHYIQTNILKELEQKNQSYSELYKDLGIRSNHFNYHLKKLLSEGLIAKKGKTYLLTYNGQAAAPYLDVLNNQPITAVVLKINYEGKTVLIKRNKEAFKGYFALPGGKIFLGETIEEAIARITEKETGLKVINSNYIATVQETVIENNTKKHHFILLLHEVEANGNLKEAKAYNKLPSKLVPSDREMLKIYNKKFATSIIRCNAGRLKQEVFKLC